MSNATDGRTGRIGAAGEALLEQGRVALEEARKPLFAVVGAGQFAASALREQLKDLPTVTQARARLLSTRAGELQERVRHINPAALRETVGSHVAQARSVYEGLAERGEQVVTRTRNHPPVWGPLGGLVGALGSATHTATHTAGHTVGHTAEHTETPAQAGREPARTAQTAKDTVAKTAARTGARKTARGAAATAGGPAGGPTAKSAKSAESTGRATRSKARSSTAHRRTSAQKSGGTTAD